MKCSTARQRSSTCSLLPIRRYMSTSGAMIFWIGVAQRLARASATASSRAAAAPQGLGRRRVHEQVPIAISANQVCGRAGRAVQG
jgi:hypothetical protein